MATAEQIKALLRSHTAGDDSLFRSVALQIAAHEATKGNERLAMELRDLVDAAKRQHSGGRSRPIPIARPSGELAGLVVASYPSMRLADVVLADPTRDRIGDVIRQHRQRELLRSHGLHPKRKLLLVGPPGTGKTLTASVLAGECDMPLFCVQLHALITRYMGETAAKLHVVFDAMAQSRGVYLFDEFDAIGATRTAGNDVGEIRRVLNSFLQFLERDDTDGIIVAATNFADMLDDALFRRFDDVVEYDLPSRPDVRRLIENRLCSLDLTNVKWEEVDGAACGLSHAEVVRACEDAARDAVLCNERVVASDILTSALGSRSGMRPARRRRQ